MLPATVDLPVVLPLLGLELALVLPATVDLPVPVELLLEVTLHLLLQHHTSYLPPTIEDSVEEIDATDHIHVS